MIEQILQTLIQSAWQILLLTLIVWPLSRLSLKAYPNFAYLLWLVVLFKALLPFNISLPVPAMVSLELPPIFSGDLVAAANENSEHTTPNWMLVLLILWAVGVLIQSSWMILRESHFRRSLKNAVSLTPDSWFSTLKNDLGVSQKVELLSSPNVKSPFMQGIANPRIYVPDAFPDREITEQQSVLAHELVHIKRRDMLVIYLQALLRIIYFFHPAIWLMNDQLDLEREKICDDEAIQKSGTEAITYGRQLFCQLAPDQETVRIPVLAGGFFMTDKSIVKRFRYLKEKRGNMKHLRHYHMILIFAVTSIALILSCSNGLERMSASQAESPENEVEFVHFDTAPEPVEGFKGLQKNVIYPDDARAAGIGGTFIIQTTIDVDGKAKNSEILKGIDHDNLRKAALFAVEATGWKPAMKDGQAVAAKISIPIVFRLKEDGMKPEDLGWRPIEPPPAVTVRVSGPNARKLAQSVSIMIQLNAQGEIINTKINTLKPESEDDDLEIDEASLTVWRTVQWEPVPAGADPKEAWIPLPLDYIFQ